MPDEIWRPQAGPQTRAITCPCDELFFGGARGGGKTEFLLLDWVSHAQQYGKHAKGLLTRRTYPELQQIMDRAAAHYPGIGAAWKAVERRWEFPNGARLTFRSVETSADADARQGEEYSWWGADEVGNYPDPAPLDKIRATLRSTGGAKARLLLTGNPGGAGHAWLKARYVDQAKPGEPFRTKFGTWAVFVPSRLADNPKLTEADPGYADRIRAAGPGWLVKAWLEGDWDVSPGSGVLTRRWMREYMRAPAEVRQGLNVYLVCDPATSKRKGSDFTAFWVIGLGADRNYYVLDMHRDRLSLSERWSWLVSLHRQWRPIRVGYERYGLQSDIEHFRAQMERENYRFDVQELGGTQAKEDRILALEPSMREGRWWYPVLIQRNVWTDTAGGDPAQRTVNVLDLYRDELDSFPAGAHDDMLDAQARILDPALAATFPAPVAAKAETRKWTSKRGSSTGWMGR